MHRTVVFKFSGCILRPLSEHSAMAVPGRRKRRPRTPVCACMASSPGDASPVARRRSKSASSVTRTSSNNTGSSNSNSGGNNKQGGLSATDKISVAIVAAGMLIFAGFCVNAGISAAATRAAASTLHKALEEATRESRALLRNGANVRWLKGEFRPNLPITTDIP